tara:strand:- start:60949 stop:63957 length:3009 start_codon:yes stop_codon:yes gene_type:complete
MAAKFRTSFVLRSFVLRSFVLRSSVLGSLALAATSVGACGSDAPRETYYEREIEPILVASCSGNTGGCHIVDESNPFGFAAGNFDVTSFENVQNRRDLLQRFGAYEVPLLLVKAVGNSGELGVTYGGGFEQLEVNHVGGSILQVGSDAYLTLLEWTNKGATENGLPPQTPAESGDGACATFVPPSFDETAIVADATYANFKDKVQPILKACSAGSCHGAPASDFYITCGDDERQTAFNFSVAQAFVDDPVANSQLLQVPLAVQSGGYFHTGGEHFASRDERDYKDIEEWATAAGPLEFGEGDAGREYFADYVQPLLLTRGCSFEACHSPQSTNDFQLRSGSQGFFSTIALERNYEDLKANFMAFEVPDARRGRAVAKTILNVFGGIGHRAGAVLETPNSGGAQPTSCDNPINPETASAFCKVQRWVDIERQALIAQNQVFDLAEGSTVNIVYVDRQESHVAGPLEFDTFQANSDLMVVPADIGVEGALSVNAAAVSLLDNCAGAADRSQVDVSGPDVSIDGTSVAFAMQIGAAESKQLYTVNIDGTACTRVTDPEAAVDGIKVHNFDPAWSPDGEWLVYASTRAGVLPPSVSRALFLPQSNIWRRTLDGSTVEQMTFLTNSEISPQFMREGRAIMSTEKVSQDFYQVAGRRMNWDITDYHPLLAQRSESVFADPNDITQTKPSVGYGSATEIREGFDGNFLAVFSDRGAKGGAGTIATFNRSVGTFEADRDDPGFLKSVRFPDAAATGRVGSNTSGAYRSPFPLLDGRIMASYSSFSGDLATATSHNWDIVALSRRDGSRQVLIGGAGAQTEAVLAIRRPASELYLNRRQLVFGGEQDAADLEYAVIHIPDAPLIFTLLTSNLRRGRPVEAFRDAKYLAFYAESPTPSGATANVEGIYESRTFMGRVPLESDGSIKVRVPSRQAIIMELQDSSERPLVTMTEEHQVGPGEQISFGIVEPLFDAVCGGCHGSVSGKELDVFVSPDVLTGASQSVARDRDPIDL